jgi:predicted enzyme related to lactoylglutathione lyase
MLKQDGKDVGALYQLSPEMVTQGVPPHWMSYVSVTNVDESAAKAKEAGATLMKEPFDVMDVGRMAVVQDPTGAVFCLWQTGRHIGAGVYNLPNSFCWNELATSDTEKAGQFYSKVFGWTRDVQQFGPMTYTTFRNNGRPAGGMYKPSPEMGNIPPHWLVYFSVDDCDAKLKQANDLGARTIAPPMDIPDTGRFAMLQDPQGAAFAIIKLISPTPPA